MTSIDMRVNNSKSLRLLSLIMILFLACEHEESVKLVITLDPEALNNTTVRLKARFNLSSAGADEYGFVWDALPTPDYDTRVVKLIGPVPKGDVIAELHDLDFERAYYVRAYFKRGSDITYGEEKSFTFGGLTPEISKLLPAQGHWDDTITIVGKNFTPIADRMTIRFGDLLSKTVRASADTIECIVPAALASGSHPVTVKVGDHPLNSAEFTLLMPSVVSFAPASATFLDLVVIQGSNFRKEPSHNIVRFGSAKAEVIDASPDALTVRVPTKLAEASSTISVQADSQRVDAPGSFALTPHVVSSVQPNSGRVGSLVTITGASFNPEPEQNEVLFGTLRADVTEASSTELKVRVPNGIYNDRAVPLLLQIAGMQADLPMFTLSNAWIRKADIHAGQFGRWGSQGFVINGAGYAGLGGGAGVSSAYQDFYRFNEATNSWTRIADYGGGKRYWTTSFVINNVSYVGTGSIAMSGEGTNDFYKYDATNDTWTRIADLPGNPATRAAAFALNGKGYVCTRAEEDNFWQYDPAIDVWTQKETLVTSPIGGGKTVVGAFVLKGRAFVLTSRSSYGELYEYDHVNDAWIRKNDVGNMGNLPALVATNTHAYYQSEYRLLQYDIDTDTWKAVDFDPVPDRNDAFFFSIDQKFYLGGGRENNYHDFWECDTSLLD